MKDRKKSFVILNSWIWIDHGFNYFLRNQTKCKAPSRGGLVNNHLSTTELYHGTLQKGGQLKCIVKIAERS